METFPLQGHIAASPMLHRRPLPFFTSSNNLCPTTLFHNVSRKMKRRAIWTESDSRPVLLTETACRLGRTDIILLPSLNHSCDRLTYDDRGPADEITLDEMISRILQVFHFLKALTSNFFYCVIFNGFLENGPLDLSLKS